MRKKSDKVDDSIGNRLARISVSLPAELAQELDMMVSRRALKNRSQLLAQLIRHELAGQIARVETSELIAGTITYVYRSDRGRVRNELAETQLAYLEEVISSQHVLLEDDQSLEVLLVQGPAIRLESLCDALRNIRGIQQLNMVATTAILPPLHAHVAGVVATDPFRRRRRSRRTSRISK